LISTVKSVEARASGTTFSLRVIQLRVTRGMSRPLAAIASE
jgi:hypothetical protein